MAMRAWQCLELQAALNAAVRRSPGRSFDGHCLTHCINESIRYRFSDYIRRMNHSDGAARAASGE